VDTRAVRTPSSSLGSLQSNFAISDYKGHVTLEQAKWYPCSTIFFSLAMLEFAADFGCWGRLFAAEVREDENRSCLASYWKLWSVCELCRALRHPSFF
jgi:hypothetical protein